MDKVRVIKRSLRCYNAAWFALVPVLGILPAVVAIAQYHKVRIEVGEAWNPAASYLRWGCVIAWCGLALSAVALGLAVIVALPKTF
jgi:hypothetical protein